MVYEMINERLSLSNEVKYREFMNYNNCRITGETIENIVISALEGGIGHWGMLDNSTPDWDNKPEGQPTSEYATQLITPINH